MVLYVFVFLRLPASPLEGRQKVTFRNPPRRRKMQGLKSGHQTLSAWAQVLVWSLTASVLFW